MIKQNVDQIMSELPDGVQLVAAVKTRTPEEILEAIGCGVKILGENYVQNTCNCGHTCLFYSSLHINILIGRL